MPDPLRRLMSWTVTIDLTLTPWMWDLYWHRSSNGLTARVGPVGLDATDDGL